MNFSREPRISPRLAQHRQQQGLVPQATPPTDVAGSHESADNDTTPLPVQGPVTERGEPPLLLGGNPATDQREFSAHSSTQQVAPEISLLDADSLVDEHSVLPLHTAAANTSEAHDQYGFSDHSMQQRPPTSKQVSAYSMHYVQHDIPSKTPSPVLPLRPREEPPQQFHQADFVRSIPQGLLSGAQQVSPGDPMDSLFQQFCDFMALKKARSTPQAPVYSPSQQAVPQLPLPQALPAPTARFGGNNSITLVDPGDNLRTIEESIRADIGSSTGAASDWAQERSRMAASSAKGPPGGPWKGSADETEFRSLQDFLHEMECSSMIFKLGSDGFRFIYLFENLSSHVSQQLTIKLESVYGAINHIPYGRQYEAATTALRQLYGTDQGNDDSTILNRWYTLHFADFPTYRHFEEEFTTLLAQLRRRGHLFPATQANGRLLAALPAEVSAWVTDHVPLNLEESEFQRRIRVHCVNHRIGTGWSALRPGQWILDKKGDYVKKPLQTFMPAANNDTAMTQSANYAWPQGTSPAPPTSIPCPPPAPQVLAAATTGEATSSVTMDGGAKGHKQSRDSKPTGSQKRPRPACHRCREAGATHALNDCPARAPVDSAKRCAKCGIYRHSTADCDNRIVAAGIPCGRCLQVGHLAFICPSAKPREEPLTEQSNAALITGADPSESDTAVDFYESLGCIESEPAKAPGALSTSIKVVSELGGSSGPVSVVCLLDTGASCNFAQLSVASKLGQTFYATQAIRLTVLTVNSRVKLDFLVVPELTTPLVIGMHGLSALGMLMWISPGTCSARTGVGPVQWHQLQEGLSKKRQQPSKKSSSTQTDNISQPGELLALLEEATVAPSLLQCPLHRGVTIDSYSAVECLAGISPIVDDFVIEEATDVKIDARSEVKESTSEVSVYDLPYTELYPQGPHDLLVSVEKGPMVLKDEGLTSCLKQLIRRDLALLGRLQQSGHLKLYDSLINSFKRAGYIRPVPVSDVEADDSVAYYMPHFPRFIYRSMAFEFSVVMMGLRPSPGMLMRALRPVASLALYILTFLFGDPAPKATDVDYGSLKIGPITRHFSARSDFSSPCTALSWLRLFLDDATITAKTANARMVSLEVFRVIARFFGFVCEPDKETDDSSQSVVKHLGVLIHHGSSISPVRVAPLSTLPEVSFDHLTEDQLCDRDSARVHNIDDFTYADALSVCGLEHLVDLNITPRKVDSWLRQFFDPMGLWLELVLRVRLLHRKMSSAVSSPDDTVRDAALLTELVALYKALSEVPRVPRYLSGPFFITVDASKDIIAAVVCDKMGTRLFARAQVIPTMRLSWTIVRQELTAILLGIDVCAFLSKLGVEIRYICTDSLINLARCTARKFRTKGLPCWEIVNIYRARECDAKLGLSMHHIPGKINPADGPTRARVIPDLLEERRQYFEALLLQPFRPLCFWNTADISTDFAEAPEDVDITLLSAVDDNPLPGSDVPEDFSNDLIDKIRSCQVDDPLCKNIVKAFEGNCPELSASYISNLKKFFHVGDDGIILRTIEAPEGRPTIVVPAALAKEVVEAVHVCAKHPGRDRTRQLVARYFWCKGLYKLVNRIVCSCDTCQRIKSSRLHRHSLGQARVRSSLPGELLGVDLLVYGSTAADNISPWGAEVDTAFQASGVRSDNNSDALPTPRYILMVVCAATYRIWTRTLATKTSAEVATVLGELLDDISPSVCLMDGGKEFANLLVRGMFVARGIQLLVVPPYVPHLAFYERCHREYQNGLRSMLLETNSPACHWWKYHSLVTHAYNNSPLPGCALCSAVVTPNDLYLAKGSTTLLPGGANGRPLSPAAEHFIKAFEAIPPSELASKVNNNVAQVAAAIRESLGVSLKLYQANWDLRRAASRKSWALASVGRRSGPIPLGTWVYVWRPAHYKVASNWIGPARVMSVRPADTYLVYWLGSREDGADGRSSTEAGYNLMPIRQAAVIANLNDKYNKIITRAAAVQRAFMARQQIVRSQPLPTPQDIVDA
ncbi:hypothetical protein FOL47_009570 [Perkinsus chesapeaki]|uniref:Integrase catalytic domain-containing protein n=1 Tax=Perkinsus chesapeaki TaxID=330153 RepID=A0A7J6L7B5_PERCH|nr:hypothetical protein FOL47_009570 [Perkinsus chesapeaki]